MAMEASGLSSILDAISAQAQTAAANRQQLAGLAAGGVIPQSMAPGPTMFQRMFGVGIDGTPAPDPTSNAASPAPQTTAPSLAPAPASASAGNGAMPASGVMSYIAQAAQDRGIDPVTAQRVALSEGGRSGMGVGDNGSSFGPFQLHYGGVAGGSNSGAGLGDDFTKATGLDARDPANAKAAIDFALDHAAAHGWGAFHGAARAGIGAFLGIGGAMGGAGGSVRPASYTPSGRSQPATGAAPLASADSSAVPSANSASSSALAFAGGGAPSAAPAGVSPPPSVAAAAAPGGGTPPVASGLPSMQQVQAMIANPATRQMGLQMWQTIVAPKTPITVKPGEQLLNPLTGARIGGVPSAPVDVAPGNTLIDPTTGRTIAGTAPKLEHTQTGVDAYGSPAYGSFNPSTGAVAPFAGAPGVVPGSAASAAPAAGGGQPAVSGSGLNTDYLKSLDPAIAAQVQAIAEGRMKPPPPGSRSPLAARLPSMVQQYDPTFDQANAEARYGTREAFAHGDVAKTIVAGNTAIQHLGDLSDQAEALNNSPSPTWNAVGQFVGNHTGGNLAGKKYAQTLGDFSGELTKFYRGTGGTEADLDRLHHDLDPSQSPAQLRAGIEQQAKLISGKVSAVQSQWHQGMGPQAQDYPIISSESQGALDRIASRPSAPLASTTAAQQQRLTPDQARALPPGTSFMDQNGMMRTRH